MAELRVTAARRLVLGVLLNAPGELYVLQVAVAAGVPLASAARALKTLEREGILTLRLERAGVRRGKPRQYYKFTAEGAKRALVLLYGSDGDGRTAG